MAAGQVATRSSDRHLEQREFTADQKQALLETVSEIIAAAATKRPIALADSGLADRQVCGAFVSLKRGGRLRSCCGSFGRPVALKQALTQAAIRTATEDPRFPPISPSELAYLDLEVWLLHHPEKVTAQGDARVESVTVGKHGLQVVRGEKRGLLLPGVPVERGWNSREFLSQVCLKAGLFPLAWKEEATTLYRYEGDAIRGVLTTNGQRIALPKFSALYRQEEIAAYADYCRDTITALVGGATPNYYCTTVSDTNVHGAAVFVSQPGSEACLTGTRLSLQTTIPLQSTLFTLCEQVGDALRRQGITVADLQKLRIGLAVLFDPAMHGTLACPDLAGFDPDHRALLVIEKSRSGWIFDASRAPEDLLQQARRLTQPNDSESAQVFSLAIQSTEAEVGVSIRPRPVAGPARRPSAVAGKFYPGDSATIAGMLDSLLGGPVPRHRWSAAMVPHAGWQFSGQVAADVLKRIDWPSTVIILSPKHTPHGVEWAVAPHQTWLLPGSNLDSDPVLARQLADSISGLELDAAAHQSEHGIEVELPLIARLSPQTRVVGIAIGGGNLARCDQFAEGLAHILRSREDRPLLLISSDMNHFATDEATRELDALALAELERLAPDALYRTVTEHHITMCGVLPAVIALKTLQKLNALRECERVAYATSADTTGEKSRVVGYAGLLFR